MSTPTLETEATLAAHPVVSREEWNAARQELLVKEKEQSRLRDRLCALRRELPWVKVDKDYVFEGSDGNVKLGDLFEGKSQLIVYHFMFGPGWEDGCTGCSFLCDHVDGARQHFENRDVAFVAVSRAPLAEFAGYKKRMGWKFRWMSSAGSDFNYDYHVSFSEEQVANGEAVYNFEKVSEPGESHGISIFYKNATGEIFHTYSCYARGCEEVLSTFAFMDMTPKGRNEEGVMSWLRRHDQYETVPAACCGCGSKEGEA